MAAPLIVTIGDLVEDVVVTSDGPPRLGTDTPAFIVRRRGGSAANVAAAVVRAGARARFVGQVGADPHGDNLVLALETEGVETCVHREGRTGSVVVLVHSDERTFLTDRGGSPSLAVAPPGALVSAAWLHAPAYAFVGDRIGRVADALLRECREADIATSVDAASVSVLESLGPEPFLRRCADLGCGVLFANEHEAALLGLPERALDAGIPVVVVKQGGDPTIVTTPNERAVVAPEPIPGRFDPTGAGDAFAAGFVVAHLSGATIADAAHAGNALAHTVLTSPRSSW